MAKVKINCYADKSDLEALKDQDLHGTISFVMSTKEIYLGKDKYCDASSEVAQAIASKLKNYYNKAEVDQKLAEAAAGGKVDLSGYVTIDKLDNLVTKDELKKKADKSELTNLATKSEVGTKADKSDLTNLATKSEVGTIKTTAEGAKTQASTNKSDIASIKAQLAGVATKEDLRNIDINLFDIVTKLPATGKTNKVYLVPDTTSTDTQNKYTEYAWISSKWEKIGEFAPKVDLSEYVKKYELSGYATKAELDEKENKSAVETLAQGITDFMNETVGNLAKKADKNIVDEAILRATDALNQLKTKAEKAEVAQAKNFAEHYLELPGVIVVDALPPVMSIINNRPEADKYKTYAVLDPDSTDPEERYIKYGPVQDKDTKVWRWERIGRCAPTKKEFNANVANLINLQKNTNATFEDMHRRVDILENSHWEFDIDVITVNASMWDIASMPVNKSSIKNRPIYIIAQYSNNDPLEMIPVTTRTEWRDYLPQIGKPIIGYKPFRCYSIDFRTTDPRGIAPHMFPEDILFSDDGTRGDISLAKLEIKDSYKYTCAENVTFDPAALFNVDLSPRIFYHFDIKNKHITEYHTRLVVR